MCKRTASVSGVLCVFRCCINVKTLLLACDRIHKRMLNLLYHLHINEMLWFRSATYWMCAGREMLLISSMCCCGSKAVKLKVEGKIMDIRGWEVSSLLSLNEIWGACERRARDLKEYVDGRQVVIKLSISPPWMPGLSALNDWYLASRVMTRTEAFEEWFCTWKYMCGSCDHSHSTRKDTRSFITLAVCLWVCTKKCKGFLAVFAS